jgi:hypothetical protein
VGERKPVAARLRERELEQDVDAAESMKLTRSRSTTIDGAWLAPTRVSARSNSGAANRSTSPSTTTTVTPSRSTMSMCMCGSSYMQPGAVPPPLV